jgi:hypothetical protein
MRTIFKLCAVVLTFQASASLAQSDRAGTWEFAGSLLDLSSASVLGPNGSSIRVDDDTGFGVSGAYNVTNRLAVGFDLNYSDPSYVATLVPDGIGAPQVIGAHLGVDVIHFKGIFNILESEITPYIEVGAGWTYLDSNIIEGYAGSACWWDPWWGYICNSYFDTYSDTRTSTSYAVGIRWETDFDVVLRAGWGVQNIDTNRAAEDIELDTIQLTAGWRF